MHEETRPLFHFTPPKNWMNDPNGLVYYNGEYHLFYQHNPFGKEWGHMSWGHAVSNDLIRWQHLPVALHEEPENGLTIFSGSAVVDANNTSGFGNVDRGGHHPIVVIYTADFHPQKQLQNIHIAYSIDSGRTFTKYCGNPVLNVRIRKFGDPKVFWHFDTAKWIMVNILGEEQGRVVMYNSSNLKTWKYLSDFVDDDEVPGKWECPDIFPLAVDNEPNNIKWILKVNSTTGAVSKYFIGKFTGKNFSTDQNLHNAYDLNFGDIYAESTWNNIPADDGRRILIGWVRQSPQEDRLWSGMQSIARTLTLKSFGKELRICQKPISNTKKLRAQSYEIQNRRLKGKAKFSLPSLGNELEIDGSFEIMSSTEFGIKVQFEQSNEVLISYSKKSNEFFVDRTGKGRLAASSIIYLKKIRLHVLIDRSIMEVFVNQGEIVFTFVVEPVSSLKEIYIQNEGGDIKITDLKMWKLANTKPNSNDEHNSQECA